METKDLLLELKWWDKDIETIKKIIPIIANPSNDFKTQFKELLNK